jgi:hypothetical protein
MGKALAKTIEGDENLSGHVVVIESALDQLHFFSTARPEPEDDYTEPPSSPWVHDAGSSLSGRLLPKAQVGGIKLPQALEALRVRPGDRHNRGAFWLVTQTYG